MANRSCLVIVTPASVAFGPQDVDVVVQYSASGGVVALLEEELVDRVVDRLVKLIVRQSLQFRNLRPFA